MWDSHQSEIDEYTDTNPANDSSQQMNLYEHIYKWVSQCMLM